MSKGAEILVTGGAGYIGSHTVVELLASGYEAVIVDNLSNSSEEALEGIRKIAGKKPVFYKADLCDKAALKSVFDKHPGIKAIIHFAALKAVGESVEKPLLYYKNNLISLINLLEVMGEAGIINMVFSSSCTVYGQPDELPVSENAPIKKAESPYGNTKQISEEILAETTRASKLQVISLRYFNPIGAHPSALIGELPLGVPNNLIPFITQTAAGKRRQLTVYGNDYPTRDGTCIRDYIHVTDLARAHVIACERLIEAQNRQAFEVFNLGTGKGLTVLEVIKAFEEVSGVKLNYTIGERRPGDVEQVYADTSFANAELSWKAEMSLEEMVGSAWKWEKMLQKNAQTS